MNHFITKALCSIFLTFLSFSCATTPKKTFTSAPGVTGNAENLTRETNDPSQEYYPSISLSPWRVFTEIHSFAKSLQVQKVKCRMA